MRRSSQLKNLDGSPKLKAKKLGALRESATLSGSPRRATIARGNTFTKDDSTGAVDSAPVGKNLSKPTTPNAVGGSTAANGKEEGSSFAQ